MKICYIDETGSEKDAPYYVMVGICFDFVKHPKCSRIANLRIASMKKHFWDVNKKNCSEIKTKKLIDGSDNWSNISPIKRKEFIDQMLSIFKTNCTNSYRIYLSVIDNEKYKSLEHPYKAIFKHPWITNALHIILQRETDVYGTKKSNHNKALTFMIFDKHVQLENLNEILYRPPKYIYDYFLSKTQKKVKNPSISATLCEGFSIDSKHSGLSQLADIYAYIIRRFIELKYGSKPYYRTEQNDFEGWVNQIRKNIYIPQFLFKKIPSTSIHSFYKQIQPCELNVILKNIKEEK